MEVEKTGGRARLHLKIYFPPPSIPFTSLSPLEEKHHISDLRLCECRLVFVAFLTHFNIIIEQKL